MLLTKLFLPGPSTEHTQEGAESSPSSQKEQRELSISENKMQRFKEHVVWEHSSSSWRHWWLCPKRAHWAVLFVFIAIPYWGLSHERVKNRRNWLSPQHVLLSCSGSAKACEGNFSWEDFSSLNVIEPMYSFEITLSEHGQAHPYVTVAGLVYKQLIHFVPTPTLRAFVFSHCEMPQETGLQGSFLPHFSQAFDWEKLERKPL